MKGKINKLIRAYIKYENIYQELENSIREVCDFNARLEHNMSDGFTILNEETSNLAPLKCVEGKSKTNKLTEEEHLDWCI
ncbi:hypothetical protein [Tenacibaculum caenipelagi]|uniref:Uncharacterized protein n=1 Tax=Tenacibaculum caenipelagi TaxID=1325435 RepID=A0A4R6TB89_9FLAO|nr:hypothetical protein [Tenacibaculum caenipelagi]TDQ22764.1 hypothetical protein DFQ07_2782 [Tenacibaculum caenipelagi]